jgi:predicted dehydrogenase/arylsulfatase A-like enzyme
MNRPNILYVCADQLRYSALACNGNPVVRTSNLDHLAREGVVFDQAFSSCPLCGPYRAQLITGRYSHINGVICNEYRLFDNQTTIAHMLRNEGYRTAHIGKWHLGHPPYAEHMRYGFDDLYAYDDEDDHYKVSYWHNEEGPFRMVDFAPRVETQLALDYIRAHLLQTPDQPFCVFLSWQPPHWSYSNSDRDYGAYPQEYNIYDKEQVDVPGNVPRQFRDFAKREIADYYGMITALDACMGQILDALDEWNLAEHTIVCFSSDHGDHLSSHGYGKPGEEWMHHTLQASKGTPYEESVHIPFILRYPARIRGNRRTNTMFSSVDVLPTLLGLCGVAIPDDVQGKDLSHAALGIPGEEPDSVYLQILGPGWPTRTKWVGLWRGVRTHQYTYARWKDRGGMRVLYDRKKDPLEMYNLIDDREHAEVARQMEERLQEWLHETKDPFDTGRRLAETEMLDLGQAFSTVNWHQYAPREYVASIEKNRLTFIQETLERSEPMTLKVAFAGTGYISRVHAQAVQSVADVERVAVVNHRPETMAKFASEFGIPRQYPDVDALLADGDVDALIVGTPNYLHAPQAIAALKAGVHVMVEKPMAMDAAEADAMVAASEKSGALLMVAHCWRFDPEVRWLQEQVEAGRLGTIIRTKGTGVHVHWGPSDWFTQKRFAGGGAMADMGIHALDTARFLLGDPRPVSVYARIGTYYGDFDVDDTGVIVVNWDNGATSTIESGWWQPHADGPEASTQLYGTIGFGQIFPTYLELPNAERSAVERVDSGFPAVRDPHCPQSMYDDQMAYFVACIRSGRTPVPGGLEGWINMRVVDAAYESAHTGKAVEL